MVKNKLLKRSLIHGDLCNIVTLRAPHHICYRSAHLLLSLVLHSLGGTRGGEMPLENLKLVHINGFAFPFPTVGVLNAISALKTLKSLSHLLQETA